MEQRLLGGLEALSETESFQLPSMDDASTRETPMTIMKINCNCSTGFVRTMVKTHTHKKKKRNGLLGLKIQSNPCPKSS